LEWKALLNADEKTQIDELIEKIPKGYNLYGFSLYVKNAKLIYEIARIIKYNYVNSYIFVGSLLATSAANFVLSDCNAIDFVVLGEGEYPILEVIKSIENGGNFSVIPSIKTRNDNIEKVPAVIDICKVPWPARDYLDDNKNNRYFLSHIVGSRGCCNNCSFCSLVGTYKKVKGPKWQGREPEDIYKEIVTIYNKYGVRSFYFTNSSFEDPGNIGKMNIEKLCDLLLNYPVRFNFNALIRAETFTERDIHLIKLMREAGFSLVFIGIESMDESDLKLYNKKATIVDNKRSYRLFVENDIEVRPGIIMLNPLSTREKLKKTYEFLTENRVYLSNLYMRHLDIYYDTEIYHKIAGLGLLKHEYTYLDPDQYYFKDPFVAEISEFFKTIMLKSKMIDEEYKLLTFFELFLGLRVFFPEEAALFENEINTLKFRLFYEISAFFRIIYVDNNLSCAKECYKEYERKMQKIFSDAKIIRMKILKRDTFRTYAMGNI
jgi:Fe-S oxidoreductase